jgi:hypothetical protein
MFGQLEVQHNLPTRRIVMGSLAEHECWVDEVSVDEVSVVDRLERLEERVDEAMRILMQVITLMRCPESVVALRLRRQRFGDAG